MKIAIASTAKTVTGEISPKGGRAPFYLIFDENFKLITFLKNPFASGGGGAGHGVAKILEDECVTKIIVGKVGENMKAALTTTNIELIEQAGLISEFLEKQK